MTKARIDIETIIAGLFGSSLNVYRDRRFYSKYDIMEYSKIVINILEKDYNTKTILDIPTNLDIYKDYFYGTEIDNVFGIQLVDNIKGSDLNIRFMPDLLDIKIKLALIEAWPIFKYNKENNIGTTND